MKFFVGLITAAAMLMFVAGCGTATAPSGGAGSGTAESGTASVEAASLADVNVDVADPTTENVVSLGAGVDKSTVAVGDVVTLAVRAKMAPAWHIYAVKGTNTTGVNVATTLDLKLPSGLEQVGDWDIPESHAISADTYAYDSDVVFRTQVKATAAGSHTINCAVGHQACNESMCRPPTSADVSVALTVE